jgi:predicted transcriptional regulator
MPRRPTQAQTQPPASEQEPPKKYLALAANIVSAYVSNNQVRIADIPSLIRGIHASLTGTTIGSAEASGKKPAVPIKQSITNDFIVCLEDGKKLRTLKRYLRTQYAMTPDQYREKWGLPRDYPMVAPSYAELRSRHAKKIGLGRIPLGSTELARKRGA